MTNQKLMKKVTPVVLSAAMMMSGMPTAALAADFSDSSVVIVQEENTGAEEIIAGEAAVSEAVEDAEFFAGTEEDGAAAESAKTPEDMFDSGESEEEFSPPATAGQETGDYVYGTANIPYADFFYGEMNDVQENASMNLEAQDAVTAAGYREDGMYDAVTSCTNSKSIRYTTSYYTAEEGTTNVTLEGIKDVNIAVLKALYEEARQAMEEGKTCNNPLFEILSSIQNVSETAPSSGEYKILNGDGTLTAMKSEVKTLSLASSITTDAVWGNYQVSVEFGENNADQPTVNNMMGVVFETSDGQKYGMEHSQNLWLRTGEIAFAVKDGFVEPHKNTIDYKRHESLEGKTITSIIYLVKDGADIVINTNLICKYLLAEGQEITGAENVMYADNAKVQMKRNVPKGSSYTLTSVTFNGKMLTEGTDYTYDSAKDVLTVKKTGNTGVGAYTMIYQDAAYEDVKTTIILNSGLKDGDIRFENNRLVVNSDTYTAADYITAATAVKVDGQALSAGKHTTVSDVTAQVFKEDGSVNFDAVLNKRDVFTKETGNPYTIELTAAGFPSVSGSVTEYEYKYVYAGLTWAQYWAAEGVYNAAGTESSGETDRRDEYDLGAFDAVTRATTNHGLHRGSYQSITIIEGNKGSYAVSHWEGANTVVFADGTKATYNKGSLTFEDGTTDEMRDYRTTGLKYVPVKVKTDDYEAFTNQYTVVENGGILQGGYGEVNLQSYNLTAQLSENTNGLKEAYKNADGSFSFGSRTKGTDSGIKDTDLKTAVSITAEVKPAAGTYGEFLRVDLTGEGYGQLGAAMQAVKWTYYGNDATYSNALETYGTKFAADNWMHKSMGIQLGLTKSARCQLPKGYDGTGYWSLTVYALGYADYTIQFQATEEHIVKSAGDADITPLNNIIAEAKALNENDYTEESWAAARENIRNELEECEDMLENIQKYTQLGMEEQIGHLREAIDSLVKVNITLDQTAVTIYLDGTPSSASLKVSANVTGTAKFKSSNTKVATVNSKGVVKAKKAGTAVITVQIGKHQATCKVTVKKAGITAKAQKTTIYTKGQTSTTIKVTKAGVTGTAKFKSSNTKIATVNSKGVVKAKKAGTVKITVQVGSYTKVVTVKVRNASLKLEKTSAVLKKGKTSTIKVNAVPSGQITYVSSNKKVASVNSKGVVKGIKKGTANITVKCNGMTTTFKVTVK